MWENFSLVNLGRQRIFLSCIILLCYLGLRSSLIPLKFTDLQLQNLLNYLQILSGTTVQFTNMYSASNSTESSQSSELLRSLVRAITNTNETLKLIHQDLAVKRLDPEKIRKTVKESVVPAIHFLRDEDGQCM